MTNDLHRRILETIARHAMARPGDRMGLGVSGGADSVAMLRIFAELRTALGVSLVVLHFNHQLRGAESDEDERFVAALAAEFHLEFQSGRADVAGHAHRDRLNVEEAARRFRYEFFASVAAAHRLDRVAVAHTVDDQAETVLSHLLRGTGIAGLAGIYPVAGPIIRPLLEVRREELRELLCVSRQSWREDASNYDTTRTRSRIRHQLIPLLLRDFDAAAVSRLSRLAGHAREDETFWRSLEDERFSALVFRESSIALSLRIADLVEPFPQLSTQRVGESGDALLRPSAPTMALTRRLVRRILRELRRTREGLTARHVRDVLDLATKSQSGARIELPGVAVERIFDRLWFTNVLQTGDATSEGPKRNRSSDFAYTVPRPEPMAPASVVVTEIHRRFNLKVIDWPSASRDTVLGRGALDFDRVRWPLVLRNWRPGDSYRPHGSRHVRKLKRLFLESRVPRSVRERWPVLTSVGKVVWASGFPAAEELAPRALTQVGLVIAEEEI